MNLKACIFDLDGVIVDTAKFHFQSWKMLADKIGASFDHEINEQLKGVSRLTSLQTILNLNGIVVSDEEKEKLAIEKNDWFVDMVNTMTREETLPGVVQFLDILDQNGIKTAVGSASKNAILALTKIDLIDRFDTIIDGSMVSEAKPNPEVFLKAASNINVAPENCVVFEDAIAGVEAALNGGMRCIGIGDSAILEKSDLVIQSFLDIDLQTVRNLI